MGVEDGAEGFRHARGFRRGQRVRDGVRKEAVHTLQVRRHQVLGQREIAGLSAFLETDAHLDEEGARGERPEGFRSEEHTSELQSLMRISYAVFCLKKKIPHKSHSIIV